MLRSQFNLSKTFLQQLASPVNVAGGNLALATTAVAGMELAGYPAVSYFTAPDAQQAHQEAVDAYMKLAMLASDGKPFQPSRHDLLSPSQSLFYLDRLLTGENSPQGLLTALSGVDHMGSPAAISNEQGSEASQAEQTLPLDWSGPSDLPAQGGATRNDLDLKVMSDQVLKSPSGIATPGASDAFQNTNSDSASKPTLQVSKGSGQVVSGTEGVDTLIGSLDTDTLIGFGGNDTFIIHSKNSTIVEKDNGGLDVAYVSVDDYMTNAELEYIQVLATTKYQAHTAKPDGLLKDLNVGWHINGNSYNQTLVGGAQADVLNGQGGSDTLIGGAGDDVYYFTGSENLIETSKGGYDTVLTTTSIVLPSHLDAVISQKNTQSVNLTGNELDNVLALNNIAPSQSSQNDANTLSGMDGNDTLIGDGGGDYFLGGAGADTFVINGQGAFAGEIGDFQAGQDKVVFALASARQPQHIQITENGFSGVAGEIALSPGMIELDWNGDAVSDVLLLINGQPTANDFSFIDPKDLPGF